MLSCRDLLWRLLFIMLSCRASYCGGWSLAVVSSLFCQGFELGVVLSKTFSSIKLHLMLGMIRYGTVSVLLGTGSVLWPPVGEHGQCSDLLWGNMVSALTSCWDRCSSCPPGLWNAWSRRVWRTAAYYLGWCRLAAPLVATASRPLGYVSIIAIGYL